LAPPDFERAKQYALTRLANELSPNLLYHSLWHTRDDVLPAAERLAALEGVTGEDLLLLRTAACFHDIGCIVQRPDHEAIGARMAAEALPAFGYTPERLRVIEGLIMATKLPQTPHTRLEEIMADADLDALGREDFFTRNAALRAEWLAQGQPMTDEAWHSNQLNFLWGHHYFTFAARQLRDAQKQKNMAALIELLASPSE